MERLQDLLKGLSWWKLARINRALEKALRDLEKEYEFARMPTFLGSPTSREGARRATEEINNYTKGVVARSRLLESLIYEHNNPEAFAKQNKLFTEDLIRLANKGNPYAAESGLPAVFAKEFEGGGSWLMTKRQFREHAEGRITIGRADGQFMTSATRMNRLIEETGGDPVLLGKRLGVEWEPGTELIRMDVTDPLLFNPRMPNASMSGANPLFRPGGLTAGGVPEIATDPLPWQQVWSTPVTPVR